jgi:hypothetical protein
MVTIAHFDLTCTYTQIVPIVILVVVLAMLLLLASCCGALALAGYRVSKRERDARTFPHPPLHTTTRNAASFTSCVSHLPGDTFNTCESTVTGALDLNLGNLDARLAALRA